MQNESHRQASIFMHGNKAGMLTEIIPIKEYHFTYIPNYLGEPISLTMPIQKDPYVFNRFPPFFDGLLPEGGQLEALLRIQKIDRNDLFSQLLVVGDDLIGAVTVKAVDKNGLILEDVSS
jgi:serine/threonine-protein kinase HipA